MSLDELNEHLLRVNLRDAEVLRANVRTGPPPPLQPVYGLAYAEPGAQAAHEESRLLWASASFLAPKGSEADLVSSGASPASLAFGLAVETLVLPCGVGAGWHDVPDPWAGSGW